MSNPFQDQLLKAGLVTKQQVQKANQDKNRKHKQKRAKKRPVPDEASIKARQAAEEKARRDRELNRRKEEKARQKALSTEINQLIENNSLERGESCDIAYNFEHQGKVKRIYVDAVMKQQIIAGKLGIARIEGRYELVPLPIAEKILQRNEKRIVLFNEEVQSVDENDPYAEYKVPDDLTW
jgi:uncharacterized protein YaiL (DUF2058 family)